MGIFDFLTGGPVPMEPTSVPAARAVERRPRPLEHLRSTIQQISLLMGEKPLLVAGKNVQFSTGFRTDFKEDSKTRIFWQRGDIQLTVSLPSEHAPGRTVEVAALDTKERDNSWPYRLQATVTDQGLEFSAFALRQGSSSTQAI